MKKTVLSSLCFFLIGTLLTAMVLLNPLHWKWAHAFQDRVVVYLHRFSPEPEETASGQLWTCGMHPQVIQDSPGNCPICGMKLTPLKGAAKNGPEAARLPEEKKVKYWRAPMDPTYISDEPGKSPMGMDLIPVYEGEEENAPAPGMVRIDPTFVQNIGVQSTRIERTDIPFTIRTVGTFTYNDDQISWINTKYEGWIEKVYVNYVGEPVHRGQPLFEIYSPQLVTTQKEYLQALDYAERLSSGPFPEMKDRAQSLLESSRQRLDFWDISEMQIRELEESRSLRRTLTVVSPVDGLVVSKMDQALEGMYVKAGMNLYKVVDLSTIWVEAEVFENQIPWLKEGQKARITLPYRPEMRYTGTVRFIYPFFNNRTRTMKVSLELPNPGLELKADMYANVTFEVPSARGVLAVPEEAVIHSGTRNIVILDEGEGRFQVSEVILGLQGNGVWEVRKGLSEGDRVVVSSQFLIDSESNLREAIQKMVADRRGPPAAATPPPPPGRAAPGSPAADHEH